MVDVLIHFFRLFLTVVLNLQGFLQYGVPSTPEKLLALLNKVPSEKIIGFNVRGWDHWKMYTSKL